jgi:hypothetical protein
MDSLVQTNSNRSNLPTDVLTTLQTEIIQAYGHWVQENVEMGWDAYLLTFMFGHLSGAVDAKIQQMHREIPALYGKMATRFVKKPKSLNSAQLLPKGLFFPDGPCFKHSFTSENDPVNTGLHMHGIVLATRGAPLQRKGR